MTFHRDVCGKGRQPARYPVQRVAAAGESNVVTADIVITTNHSHKRIAVQHGSILPDDVFIVRSGPDFDRLQVLDQSRH